MRSRCSRRPAFRLPVLSGGGSPALLNLADYPMMTEHRAGTYVYNDVMMVHSGIATWDDCAMHVRTTVVSRPTEDRAIVDAGSKVLTREQYYVKNFGHVVEYPDAVVANLSEEHGMIDLSASARKPKVGDVINIVPNHCCVVSNMVDEVYGLRDGKVEAGLAGRGARQGAVSALFGAQRRLSGPKARLQPTRAAPSNSCLRVLRRSRSAR